jgi:hypothetical protein
MLKHCSLPLACIRANPSLQNSSHSFCPAQLMWLSVLRFRPELLGLTVAAGAEDPLVPVNG